MALDTHEKMDDVFYEICTEVVKAVCERTKKLLYQHINTDTYDIPKNSDKPSGINTMYLYISSNDQGTPSYEFRDKAWDVFLSKTLFSIIFDGSKMTPPNRNGGLRLLHGNYKIGADRREELADDLNVYGPAKNEDFPGKLRKPYWDNFIEELNKKLGHWLYTEFNNRGLKIESLKNAKF